MSAAKPLTIGMHGASGRMGTRIIQLLRDDPSLALGAAVVGPNSRRLGDDLGDGVSFAASLDRKVDVVIDFATPSASLPLAERCAAMGIPLVVGTTGFEAEEKQKLEAFSATIPVLVSANFSKAVNLLFRLAGEAAKALGRDADIEIVERHHHFKKDAPSGTALKIADVVGKAINSHQFVCGRGGLVGERPKGEIGIHALRAGDNPGEHTVVFGLMGECLELSHRALNRDGFARGALDAAKFLANKPPGLYTMDDLLGSS